MFMINYHFCLVYVKIFEETKKRSKRIFMKKVGVQDNPAN